MADGCEIPTPVLTSLSISHAEAESLHIYPNHKIPRFDKKGENSHVSSASSVGLLLQWFEASICLGPELNPIKVRARQS